MSSENMRHPAPTASGDRTPGLSLARAPSLAEQAAEAIVTGIASGVIQPGQRLREVELAGMLQMSRVPLREALKILEAQGITASAPHKGSYVQPFDQARIDQICEVRIALEKIAVRGAAETYAREPQRIARLDAILADMERAAARLSWMEVNRADVAFHREICQASENGIVLTLWESLARHVFIIFGLEVRHEEDAPIIDRNHWRLRELLREGAFDILDGEIERHVLRLRQPNIIARKKSV